MVGRNQTAVLHDPADQNPGEQEVGKHHNTAITQPHHLPEARLHQGKRDPGVQGFAPAEAEALHQHAGDLRHIGVGVGIRRPPPHHHQQRVVGGHRRPAGRHSSGIGGRQRIADTAAGRLDHFSIHPQLAPVIHPQTALGGPGVEHRGDVILGMAGGEEHGRHRQHMTDPPGPQFLQAIAQDRPRELQIAIGHRHRRQGAAQLLRQGGELLHRQPVAAAMAANKHPQGPYRPPGGGGGTVEIRRGERGHGNEFLGLTVAAATRHPVSQAR